MPKSKQDKDQKIVCNASPIINLSKINRLDLIEKLYQKIIIPGAVFKELIVRGHDKENIPAIKSLIDNNIIDVQEVQSNALVRALEKDLDSNFNEVEDKKKVKVEVEKKRKKRDRRFYSLSLTLTSTLT